MPASDANLHPPRDCRRARPLHRRPDRRQARGGHRAAQPLAPAAGPAELRDEIYPKNIILIGPTGVGKTEIARRLAKLAQAPFVKVEATKFTEVGYVGRDVESMVRDLVEAAIALVREEETEKVRSPRRARPPRTGWSSSCSRQPAPPRPARVRLRAAAATPAPRSATPSARSSAPSSAPARSTTSTVEVEVADDAA